MPATAIAGILLLAALVLVGLGVLLGYPRLTLLGGIVFGLFLLYSLVLIAVIRRM